MDAVHNLAKVLVFGQEEKVCSNQIISHTFQMKSEHLDSKVLPKNRQNTILCNVVKCCGQENELHHAKTNQDLQK